MIRTAEIDPTGKYRYRLTREWDDSKPSVLWIMLNPSTADALVDDPTIRRCIGFARSWGYGGIVACNLFALRATDPRELKTHPDPVGPDNDRFLDIEYAITARAIAAWGIHGGERAKDVLKRLHHLQCLGITKHGHPKHPLYALATLKPTKLKEVTGA